MDPATLSLGGGLLNSLGGIIGGIVGGGKQNAAYQTMINAAQLIDNLGVPANLAAPIILNQFKQAGLYTPQLEQAVNQGISQYQNIPQDTQSINAQQQALQALQQRGTVGLNAQDRVALNQVRNQAGADAEGRRQQILQNFAQMGYGGRNSGASLAQQLQASQGESNQEAQQANQQAATAAQRALDALGQSANLSTQIRGQNFDIASQKAAAEDAMNRFNIQNQMAQQQFNVGNQNQAALYNQQNAQNIANQNTQQNNQNLYYQNQMKQQNYLNQLGLAQAQYGAQQGVANAQLGQAGQIQNAISGIGAGLGGALSAYGQQQTNQNNMNNLFATLGMNNLSNNFSNLSTPAVQAGQQYNSPSEGIES